MVYSGLKFQTAHAILLLDGKIVLQLRDNKPKISAPGYWSLFGGRIKANERPLQALKREIMEELSIKPKKFKYLWFFDYYGRFERTFVRTWMFAANVGSVWNKHNLNEGRDVNVFSRDDIEHMKIPAVMKKEVKRYFQLGTEEIVK